MAVGTIAGSIEYDRSTVAIEPATMRTSCRQQMPFQFGQITWSDVVASVPLHDPRLTRVLIAIGLFIVR
jgi:hypothetical protein